MAIDPEMPHTQTSAPTQSPDTTEDVTTPQRDAGAGEQQPSRQAEPHHGTMPAGADEPGAGL